MSFLNDLKKPAAHQLKPIFDKYSRAQIAKSLKIHSAYLGNILCGHMQPSDSLEKKLHVFAKKIIEAEEKSL
jgi:hypothetical protein